MIPYFQVQGKSMEPFCSEGDFVIAERMSYLFSPLQVGHVVVLQHPFEDVLVLKRIRWVKEEQGKGFYWVQGDNQKESKDSRSFGWVSADKILGRAQVIHKTQSLAFDILQ